MVRLEREERKRVVPSVRIFEETAKSVAQIARDLGVNEGTLGGPGESELGSTGRTPHRVGASLSSELR